MSFKGAMQSHSSLVFAVSEEKQVHETFLRLILGRVNASAALCTWASKEENLGIRELAERVHQATLLWSNIQKQYAEQYSHIKKALEDILQVELGIDAIKKQYQDCYEKIDRLRKQLSSNRRKSDMSKVNAMEEELAKALEFQGELASELQVKALKAELFKNTKFKLAIRSVVQANLECIGSLQKVFLSALEMVERMPDIPVHLGLEPIQKKAEKSERGEIIAELSKELNSRIVAGDSFGRQKSVPSHIDLIGAGSPPSPTILSPMEDIPIPHLPKRAESTKRPAQIRAQLGLLKDGEKIKKRESSKSDEPSKDFESVPAPNTKKESKISVIKRKVSQGTTLRRKKSSRRRGFLAEPSGGATASAEEASSSDEFEEPGYVCPNDVDGTGKSDKSPPRRRRASTGTMPIKTPDDYTDPWDTYQSKGTPDTYDKYLEPYDAIVDVLTKRPNEVQWQFSPLSSAHSSFVMDKEDDIYDVITDPSPPAQETNDDYIYDVILATPAEKSDKKNVARSEKNTKVGNPESNFVVGVPMQVNVSVPAPELPPRRLPGKPPRSPDLPIPPKGVRRVDSEPAHLCSMSYSPKSVHFSQASQTLRPSSPTQRNVPPKPPRKATSRDESPGKPPKLPPRKSETVEYEEDENSIYEPVNVNVKDMIAMLQEKSVKMPHLVNPMMQSSKNSSQ